MRHAENLGPLSGTVSAVHVKTIGTVVQVGTVVVDIVLAELVCWRGPGFAETCGLQSVPEKFHGCLFWRITRHAMAY